MLQLVGQLVAAVPHRPPVGHRDADVVERGDEVLAQQLQARGVAAVDLDVDPGLVRGPLLDPDVRAVVADHPEHRVDDEVDAEPHRRHRHADGVDEEGHVVGDDLDDGVRRLPAVRDQVRVEDLDVGRALGADLAQPEVGQRRAQQVARLMGLQVERGQVLEVAAQEAVAPLLELGRELPVDQLQHGSQTTAGSARRLGGTTVGRGPVSHDLVPFPSSRRRWRERSPTS